MGNDTRNKVSAERHNIHRWSERPIGVKVETDVPICPGSVVYKTNRDSMTLTAFFEVFSSTDILQDRMLQLCAMI